MVYIEGKHWRSIILPVYYLISQMETDDGFPKQLGDSLVNDFATLHYEQRNITFVCADPDNYKTTEQDVNIILGWFQRIGILFHEVFILDNRMSMHEKGQYMKHTGIVFLLGGNPITQIGFMRKNNLFNFIQSTAHILVGMSAGAINMCRVSLCSKDDENDTTIVYSGLGFVDVTIEPHFDIHNMKLMKEELFPVSNNNAILAVPDNSFIRVEDEKMSFHGEAYVIYKNRIWFHNEREK